MEGERMILETKMQHFTHMERAIRTLHGWYWTEAVVGCSFTERLYWSSRLHARCILATLEAMQGD